MLAGMQFFCFCVSLALAGQRCSTAAAQQQAAALPPVAALAPQPAVPLAPLLRALLDTTAARSTRIADTRRNLQAGAEVRALYDSTYAPAWTQPSDSLNTNATAALTLLAHAPAYGLRPTDYGWPRLHSLRDSLTQPALPGQRARQQARLELYLSDAVLTFMRDLGRGRLHPYTTSAREKAAGPAGQSAALLRAALGHDAVPAALLACQPTNREYRQLQQALARWLARPVASDSAAYHQARYEQVAVNLERWRWEALPDSEYVLINLPAYELQVIAHNSVQRRHHVIVGKPQTPTPTLSSNISYFTLAPNWHVPHSIATEEMLPRIKADARYFALNNLALYDDRGRLLDPYSINWVRVTAQQFPYTIRQSAGCENALGNIVFRFANPYSVYLHDTPERQFFAQPQRALSHGCIRLESPLQLAAYLLRREAHPVQLPNEAACARQPRPRDVRLHHPLALHIRYATCVAERGQLHFYADIYHRDEAVRLALFGPTPALGPVTED